MGSENSPELDGLGNIQGSVCSPAAYLHEALYRFHSNVPLLALLITLIGLTSGTLMRLNNNGS